MGTSAVLERPVVTDLQLIPGTFKSLGQISSEFRDVATRFYRGSSYGELSELLDCYADKVTPSQLVRLFRETFITLSVPYVLDCSTPFHKATLFKWADLFRRHSRRFASDPHVHRELIRAQSEVNLDRDWIDPGSWWKPLESSESWFTGSGEPGFDRQAA